MGRADGQRKRAQTGEVVQLWRTVRTARPGLLRLETGEIAYKTENYEPGTTDPRVYLVETGEIFYHAYPDGYGMRCVNVTRAVQRFVTSAHDESLAPVTKPRTCGRQSDEGWA